jgi:hypothetical protein
MSQASGLSGRWSTWSSHLGVWRAQHLADLDGLAHGYSIGPWSCRGLRGDLDGSFERLDIDQSVTGKQFLGFRERAVGDHRCAGPTRHNEPGLVGTGQTLGVDQLATLKQFVVQSVLEINVGLDVSPAPFAHRHTAGLDLAVVCSNMNRIAPSFLIRRHLVAPLTPRSILHADSRHQAEI